MRLQRDGWCERWDQMQAIRDGFARRLRDMQTETLDERSYDRDSRAMPRRNVHVRSSVIFGVATALGLFSGFQAYYYVSTFTEWPASLPFLLALNLGYWYSWAALTPAILYLARKAPFLERDSWKSALAVHIPGVLIITMLHVALTV